MRNKFFWAVIAALTAMAIYRFGAPVLGVATTAFHYAWLAVDVVAHIIGMLALVAIVVGAAFFVADLNEPWDWLWSRRDNHTAGARARRLESEYRDEVCRAYDEQIGCGNIQDPSVYQRRRTADPSIGDRPVETVDAFTKHKTHTYADGTRIVFDENGGIVSM